MWIVDLLMRVKLVGEYKVPVGRGGEGHGGVKSIFPAPSSPRYYCLVVARVAGFCLGCETVTSSFIAVVSLFPGSLIFPFKRPRDREAALETRLKQFPKHPRYFYVTKAVRENHIYSKTLKLKIRR